MKHQYALGLLLALSAMPPVSAIRAAEPSSIVISEIAWAGSEKSTADEWIEIRNTGTETVDVSSWSLTGVGTSGSTLTIPSGSSLSAGSSYLIANYALADPKTTLVVQPNLVTTAVSIPNTSLNVALLDSTGAMSDSLVDPGTPDFGSSITFSTMKRDLSSKAWFTEDASTNVSHEIVEVVVDPAPETPVDTTPPASDNAPIAETPEQVVAVDPVATEPVVAEPAVIDQVATDLAVPDPAVAASPTDETPVIDPVVTEPIVIEEPVVAPIIENPVIAVAPEVIEIAIDPVIAEPIILAESPAALPVVIEELAVPDLVIAPIEPIAVVETPIVSTPIVASTPPPLSTSTAKVGDVIISELLSSPSTGNDEWVELKNMTITPLLLDGLTLVDASGKVTNLSGTIDANGYTLIPNPNGKLNNDDDSVTLVNGALTLDSVSYGDNANPAPKKDVALALVDGVWITATPTPAVANVTIESAVSALSESVAPIETQAETIIPTISPTLYAHTTAVVTPKQTTVTPDSHEPTRTPGTTPTLKSHVVAAVQSVATADPAPASASVKAASTSSKAPAATKTPKSTVKKTSTSKKSSVRSVTIDDVATLADGTKVKLEGIVVATAGILGKRSFFLDGLEVYQSNGNLADVQIGDRVSITGEVSVLFDHRRVNIQEDAARVIDQSSPIVHDYASTLPYGSLARVTGTVSARDGNAVLLNTDHGTITLVPGNGVAITWADLASATITATGILKHGDQETLVLRSNDDIVREHGADMLPTATIAGTAASQSSLLWMTGALLAVGSAGFGAWVWNTRPKARTPKLILHPTNV